MTKLPPDAEQAIRRLDDEDDTDDPEMAWARREPYRHLVWPLLSTFRSTKAFIAFAAMGYLDHYATPKRKPGERHRRSRPPEFAIDDVRRLKNIWPRQRYDGQVTRELIAAERCRRLMPHDGCWGQWCTIDKLDHSHKPPELQDLIDKIRNRLRRGTTGGERYRRAKLRAK